MFHSNGEDCNFEKTDKLVFGKNFMSLDSSNSMPINNKFSCTTMEALIFFHEACCGVKPKENWVDSIKWFSEKYKILHMRHDISITNKVHIIFDHVED